MEVICHQNKCTGCCACAIGCPKHAISMEENNEGFFYPNIDQSLCINCGLCKKICPVMHIWGNEANGTPEMLAGFHLNRDILLKSSSGGAFSAIAELVIRENGIVFGAALDVEKHIVYHTSAESMEDLAKMRLSKYFQSEIRDSYIRVRRELNRKRKVLFSGTACQIAGLLSYLGNIPKDNLITVDVLCHGVASKKIVNEYLLSQQMKKKEKITNFQFRVKDGPLGWQGGEGHRMKLSFEGGEEFVAERPYDTYFLGYNNNLFLRESCYNCNFCGMNRISDFTIADYWGKASDLFAPDEMKNGISLILLNSKKAKVIQAELEKIMQLRPANVEMAIKYNRALSEPQSRPALRDRFFAMVEKHGYDGAIMRIFKKRFVKYRIKKIIKKVFPPYVSGKILKNV